mgnify:CR=1 FL=1
MENRGGVSVCVRNAAFGATVVGLAVGAEAVDRSPCRAQRVTVTATLGMLAGGVGGAFTARGAPIAGGVASGTGYALEGQTLRC